jgi:hypothetical protein
MDGKWEMITGSNAEDPMEKFNAEFKERIRAEALTEYLFNFNDISMENITMEEFSKIMADVTTKYENIQELAAAGTCAVDSTEKAWSVISAVTNLKMLADCRIYKDNDGKPLYAICWGAFGNEDVTRFDDYFKIKDEYVGWEAGLQYGV